VPPTAAARLYSLDVLRGVAAIAVVFWHWRHFFYDGLKVANDLDPEHQPLYSVFFPFYLGGDLAVDLFFLLSGFIFFWLYAQPVTQRSISAAEFLALRASRLYPLHLVTLGLVLIAQAGYWRLAGTHFVYPMNDGYHFVLNLLFVSSVGLERGFSFNGPSWSISVEVVLYAAFFVLCRFARPGFRTLMAVSVGGFLALLPIYAPLARGIGAFFFGGCVYYLYAYILRTGHAAALWRALVALAAGLWAVTAWFLFANISLGSIPFLWRVQPLFPRFVLFPITVLALALFEAQRGAVGKKLSFLGDISYSSYLWHFPLQLLVMLPVVALGIDRSVFYSPLALVAFLGLLIAVSLASFHYLELPAQRSLRRAWGAVPRAAP
jgi:peptidoglycan/LPS O-acetylase OafA/YrhL